MKNIESEILQNVSNCQRILHNIEIYFFNLFLYMFAGLVFMFFTETHMI